MALFFLVLLALFARERTGQGTRVSCPCSRAGLVDCGDDPGEAGRRAVSGAQAARGRASFTSVYYAPPTGALQWRSSIRSAIGRRSAARSAGPSCERPALRTLEIRVKEGRMAS
jgi:hypothetical protein